MKKSVVKILTIICLVAAMTACVFVFTACDTSVAMKNFESSFAIKPDAFSETTRFYIDDSALQIMDTPSFFVKAIEEIAVDMDKTYFEFRPDGTMHMQLTTKDGVFGKIQGLLEDNNIDISAALTTFDIKGSVNGYVEPMFPGFAAKLSQADLEGALELIHHSLGFYITGLDYEDDGVKEALAYIAENMALPADLLSKIPADTVLQLTFDQTYGIRKLKGADGKEYTAIYIGALKDNDNTAPFGVFTLGEKDGAKTAVLRIEFMNITIGVKTK